VPSERAGAHRNRNKKDTNQIVKNNVEKTDEFVKKMSFVDFWKNARMTKQGTMARKLLDHDEHEQSIVK